MGHNGLSRKGTFEMLYQMQKCYGVRVAVTPLKHYNTVTLKHD